MTQPAPVQQNVRDEERVLGITYERALVILPRLLKETSGGEVGTLGDGYFVVTSSEGTSKREMTVRLGREGADTRVSLRVETFTDPRMTMFVIVVAMLTAGLGVLLMLPWAQANQRRRARERDLLVHKTLRAIEDAVASQGAAPNYRVAPGADAVLAEPLEIEEAAPEDERAALRTR